MGAIISAPLMVIGEKLGLYKAMADAGPLTLGGGGRALRRGRALGARVAWQPGGRRLRQLRPRDRPLHAARRARARARRRGQPLLHPRRLRLIASLYADEDQITEAFRSGEGMGWHEHDHRLFRGTERFFRPGYRAHLVAEWIPALDGVEEKLERGAKVADVGCGHGASTIIMAEAFPNSEFFGFDYHDGSIERAHESGPRKPASTTGSPSRSPRPRTSPAATTTSCACSTACTTWATRSAPRGTSTSRSHADGTWMIVEPFADDSVEENLNPVGRVFYGASTVICTPASLAQEVGLALGAQAGEARLTEVLERGRLQRVRRATETPFNLILEATP